MGGGGAAALPRTIFEPLIIFWGQQEKIWAKPVFKDVSCFFLLLLFVYFFYVSCFFYFLLLFYIIFYMTSA